MHKLLEDRILRRLVLLARGDHGRLRRYLRVTEATEQKERLVRQARSASSPKSDARL